MKMFNTSKYADKIIKPLNMEIELLTMLEFYKASFELSPLARIVLEDGIVVKFNESAVKLFGLADGGELGGKPLINFFVEHDSCKQCILLQPNNTDCKQLIKTKDNKVKNVIISSKGAFINNRHLVFVTVQEI